MSHNDPALGFFAQKSKVRVVSIALWCLVVLLAFLTAWTTGVAGSGTGGTPADRAPALLLFMTGTSVLAFGALIVDITTAGVRDDLAWWGVLRLFGSLGLGLAAGSCAHDIALKSFPAWWLPILLLISIAILCVPVGVARLERRHGSSQTR
ncbi:MULTISPECIES: hypothetical protein [Brevibacterium]|uniref:Uncharacterized protein n=2 Tax=Brevibacterium TaxID=1696 RepID=A0A1H1R4Q0_BRESA|nr:hypothetical protein [Brevibacterium sandarakinum]SDS30698.1 hypothetical protein SAMN04489751_1716 [Brevibacterium sandarakinum]